MSVTWFHSNSQLVKSSAEVLITSIPTRNRFILPSAVKLFTNCEYPESDKHRKNVAKE